MDPFAPYTAQALSFRLAGQPQDYAVGPYRPGSLDAGLRQAARAGHCVLLGAGAGAALADIRSRLPGGVGLSVCELYPAHAAALEPVTDREVWLLADASETALAWMLFSAGLVPGRAACLLNPEVADPTAKARFKAVQRLHAAYSPLEIPAAPAGRPSLGVAAILHPGEPDLEGFFAALPGAACEAVALWDAPEPPAHLSGAPIPVRHLAHPLGADFAAQRNRLLAACRTDWVLMLDADERLDQALAALLPGLVAQGQCASFAFPRRAVGPGGVKVGFGLWPDLQLRLFRRLPGLRFVRPVHERLEGLSGPTGLCIGAGIRHLCDSLKQSGAIDGKLALFDQAAGREGLHRRSGEYPTVPEEYLAGLPGAALLGQWPESVSFLPL
ncbi:hypothetical protein [Fundidesulfovibrio soli]|uniref:hypothetical protein n=1 Tax=Fundidesulfovibrio soli TaxID=2922716 RepID=UPI001FAEA340|nr:hypothetical protein [Fundidesulfovibrio soli]